MRVDNSQAKVFGVVLEGVTYTPRPAAYAAIQGVSKEIAVVKTSGGYFLPGGGSQPGEALDDTLHRMVREELARNLNL